MEILSREYGWTPSQIRKQNVIDIENYFEIIRARNKIEKQQNDKLKRR
jgi:hypothetical protein